MAAFQTGSQNQLDSNDHDSSNDQPKGTVTESLSFNTFCMPNFHLQAVFYESQTWQSSTKGETQNPNSLFS